MNGQIMVVWSNKSDYFSTFFGENVELVKKCKYLFKYGNTSKMAYVFFALHRITTGIWIVRFLINVPRSFVLFVVSRFQSASENVRFRGTKSKISLYEFQRHPYLAYKRSQL